jgi:hypothetical protein
MVPDQGFCFFGLDIRDSDFDIGTVEKIPEQGSGNESRT